jgi:hypothetical protein
MTSRLATHTVVTRGAHTSLAQGLGQLGLQLGRGNDPPTPAAAGSDLHSFARQRALHTGEPWPSLVPKVARHTSTSRGVRCPSNALTIHSLLQWALEKLRFCLQLSRACARVSASASPQCLHTAMCMCVFVGVFAKLCTCVWPARALVLPHEHWIVMERGPWGGRVSERVDWVVVGHAWCDNSHNTSAATTQAAEISGDFDAPYPQSHTRLLTGCQTPKVQRYSGARHRSLGRVIGPPRPTSNLTTTHSMGSLLARCPGVYSERCAS